MDVLFSLWVQPAVASLPSVQLSLTMHTTKRVACTWLTLIQLQRTLHTSLQKVSFSNYPSDIRDLISAQDVMEELDLGPNGSLIYCLEYLIENMDWLEQDLSSFTDDYLLIDCPGQIEVYTHYNIMKKIIGCFQQHNYRVCALYLMESHFIDEAGKYFSGVLSAMSTMIQLEVPHLNVLTKMDLCALDSSLPDDDMAEIYKFLNPSPFTMLAQLSDQEKKGRRMPLKFEKLTQSIVQLVEEYNMVGFLPLNINEEESIEFLFSQIDNCVQFGEDVEPKEPEDEVEYEPEE